MSIAVEVHTFQGLGHVGVARDSETGTAVLLRHDPSRGWMPLSAFYGGQGPNPLPPCFALDYGIELDLDVAAGLYVDGSVDD